MIRVVLEQAPNLYALTGEIDEKELGPTMHVLGSTYYRAYTKNHFVMYRRAISGWGAAAPNPSDPRPVFAPGQR